MTDASDPPRADAVSSAPPGADTGASPARPSPDQLSRNWWALAGRGVAAIVFGLIAVVLPGAALLSLAILFSAYLFVDGGFGIVSAVRAARGGERWGWLLAEGVLNLVMAIIAFVFPVGAILAFVLVTAIWAILTGGMMLASAFRLSGQGGGDPAR